MLIEQFINGKTIICESCGFDYNPPANAKDIISTISPDEVEEIDEQKLNEGYNEGYNEGFNEENNEENKEEKNTYDEKNNEKLKPNVVYHEENLGQHNYESFMVNGQYSRINEKMILKSLSGNWKTMRELARDLNVQDAREFYVLRMILNEMHRKNIITMDFQIDRVLIRRK